MAERHPLEALMGVEAPAADSKKPLMDFSSPPDAATPLPTSNGQAQPAAQPRLDDRPAPPKPLMFFDRPPSAKTLEPAQQEARKQNALDAPIPDQGVSALNEMKDMPENLELSYEGEGGLPVRRPYGRTSAAEIYSVAKNSGQRLDLQLSAAQNLTGDPYLPESVSEVRKLQEPAWYESIFQLFEPFDVPRRVLWQFINELGSALPNPTQPGASPTVTSAMGDALQYMAGEAMGNAMQLAAFTVTGGAGGELVGEMLAALDEGTVEPDRPLSGYDSEVWDTMGKRLYESVATGELNRIGEINQSDVWFWGDTKWSNPRGVHLVDVMITREEAAAVAASTDNQNLKAMMNVFGSDVGRELMGLVLEMAVDPLWLLGPAKGTQVVNKGNDVYQMGNVMNRAAGAMERVNPEHNVRTIRRVMLDAVDPTFGPLEETATAARTAMQQGVDQARDLSAHANKNADMASEYVGAVKANEPDAIELASEHAEWILLDQARQAEAVATRAAETGQTYAQTRALGKARELKEEAALMLKEPEAAVEFLNNYALKERRVAKAWKSDADQIDKALDFAYRGEGVTQQGYVAWHMPFAGETRYLAKAEDGKRVVKKVQDFLGEPLVQRISDITDYARDLSPSVLTAKAAEAVANNKLISEQLSKAETWALAFYETTGSASIYPMALWDWITRAVGTRHIQPLVSALSVDKQLAGYGRSSVTRTARSLTRLRKANPEVWGNYQDAIGNYMRTLQGMEAKLGLDIRRLTYEAEQVKKARGRIAEKELAKVRRSMLDVEKDIAKGQDRRLELVRLREQEQQFERWLSKDYSVNDVLLDVAALIDEGAGVLAARPELRAIFADVQELLQTVKQKLSKDDLEVSQTLANLARHMRGDPLLYEEVMNEVRRLEQVKDDLKLAKEAELVRLKNVVNQRTTEIRAAKRMVKAVNVESLGDAIAKLLATTGQRTYSEVSKAHIKELLDAVFETAGDPRHSTQVVLREAAILMGDTNGARALLDLGNILHKEVTLLPPDQISGMSESNALVEALRRYLKRLEEEEAELKTMLQKGFEAVKAEGEDMKIPRALVDRMISYREARIRSLVGEADLDEFEQWVKNGAEDLNATLPATGKLSREGKSFRDSLGRVSNVYSQKQLDRMAELADARANAWAAVSGRSPSEYWKEALDPTTKKTTSPKASGAITPANPTLKQPSVLTVRPDADPSTFIHELGHVFRFDMVSMGQNGEEYIRAWCKWAKIDDLADDLVEMSYKGVGSTWSQMRSKLSPRDVARVEVAEEMWADAFIGYMRRGRAPTKNLEPVFKDFRVWMDSLNDSRYLYQAARELVTPADLTPEVRRLFDALLGPPTQVKAKNWTEAHKHVKALGALKRVRGPKSRQVRWVTIKANRLAEVEAEESRRLIELLGVSKATGTGTGKGIFRADRLNERRFARLLEQDPTRASLERAFRDDLVDMGVSVEMADNLAKKMRKAFDTSYDRYHQGVPKDAVREAVKAARKALKDAEKALGPDKKTASILVKARYEDAKKQLETSIERLKEYSLEVVPRLAPPNVKDITAPETKRLVSAWERELWVEFEQLVERYQLSDQDALMAAMAGLREMPQILPDADIARIKVDLQLPSAMGRRAGDLPEMLEPVAHEMRRIIASYEALYAKHGEEFVRKPEEMLRLWGVFEYVPHLSDPGGLLARTGSQRLIGAVAERARGGKTAKGNSLEEALSINMDASKRREIEGTVAEINATANSAVTFAMSPELMYARYGQANSALSAQELLLSLFRGGVIRIVKEEERAIAGGKTRIAKVWEVAEEQDLVPLFQRRSNRHDDYLLMHGDRAAWKEAQIKPEEVGPMIHKKRETQAFASWAESIPAMRQITQTEDTLLGIRGWQYLNDQELMDPLEIYKDLVVRGVDSNAAWKEVAVQMNQVARKANVKTKVNADMLKQYYEGDGAWRLYLPRVVAESMNTVFGGSVLDALPGLPTLRTSLLQPINNWWKTRVTVMSIAFSMRNMASNLMTNLLDLGPMGALNPKTNGEAILLAQAVLWHDHYGSLKEARALLNAPVADHRLIGRSKIAAAKIKADHEARRKVFELTFGRLLDNGFDLGDGRIMDVDDLLSKFRDKGVVSQAFTQFVDLTAMEHGLAEAMLRGGGGLKQKVVKAASVAEDMVVVGWSGLMTGGVPVAVPKWVGGEFMSRTIENQSRIANFLGNYRRNGNWSDAIEHVERFLFNYGDLTATQKSWMRLIFPFFTWNQKNMALQWHLLQTSPVAFSQFHRVFLDGLPRALEAYQAHEQGLAFVPTDQGDITEVTKRETHRLHTVRLPYPGQLNTYISGLGLPQEAFAEKIGQLFGMLDISKMGDGLRQHIDRKPMLRFLGESHALLRLVAERAMKHHVFYDIPISQLTNGRLLAQLIAPLDVLPDAISKPMQDYIMQAMQMHITSDYNDKTGSFDEMPLISGSANHLFGSLPWSRIVRDAAAYSNFYLVSNATPMHKWIGQDVVSGYGDAKPIHWMWRLLDVWTGVSLVHEDPRMLEVLRQMKIEDTMEKIEETRGIIKKHDTAYIPKPK